MSALGEFEVGDWVSYKNSTTGNVYLVIALCYGNEVRVTDMPVSISCNELVIVQKNNRPIKA